MDYVNATYNDWERFITKEEALQIVRSFIDNKFEGGRHERRVNKI